MLHATPPYPTPAGAQWEKAQELFEQMQHRGCKPDAVTFSGLISSYDRAGAWGRGLFRQLLAARRSSCYAAASRRQLPDWWAGGSFSPDVHGRWRVVA